MKTDQNSPWTFARQNGLIILISCFALPAAPVGCRRAEPAPSSQQSSSPAKAGPPPSAVTTDPDKIFRRAFWKRPAAGDKILGAERREWLEKDGQSKWQWFIAVRPSPELVKHLREDNAFGLRKGGAPLPADNAPAWFDYKPDDVEVLRSATGDLQFIFNKSDNVLYAASFGKGLTPGAPEAAAPAAAATAAAGRLPLTPPPTSPTP